MLYVGDLAGRLWYLDAASGEVRTWLELEASITRSVAIVGRTIYAVDGNALAHAVDAQPRVRTWRGERRVRSAWSYLRLTQPLPIPPPPPATVARAWTRALRAPPAQIGADESHVYIATSRGIEVFVRATGATAWLFEGDAATTGMVISDSRVYLGTEKGVVASLESKNGRVEWTTSLPNASRVSLLSDGRSLYAMTASGHLYRLR